MKKNILIWTEANSKIGYGHFKRCVVLANELKKFDFNITFLQRIDKIDSCSGPERILACGGTREGYNLICCNTIERFLDLSPLYFDLFIADSYDLTEEIIELARKRYKYVIVIDDLNNLNNYDVDLLINGDYQAPTWNYNCRGKVLLGVDYLLIDPKFKPNPSTLKNQLLVLAGATNDKLMDQILEVLKPVKKYDIVPVNLSHYCNQRPIQDLMAESTLAISACGMSIYELISCGVPVIGLITAENQRASAESLAAAKWIKLVSDIEELPALISRFIPMTEQLGVAPLIDNKSAERVAIEVKRLLNA